MTDIDKSETCGSCRFAAAVPGDLMRIQCRRMPPTPVVVGVTRDGPMLQSLFPENDRRIPGCGCYEHKPSLIIGQAQGEA